MLIPLAALFILFAPPAELPAPSTALPTDAEAITAGVSRLVAMQEKGPGSDIVAEWPYEGVYRVGGKIPYGYSVGGTSIACLALMEAPGFAADTARQDAV